MKKSDFAERERQVYNSVGETKFWCEPDSERPKHTICLRGDKYYVREYCYHGMLLHNCKLLYGPFDTWELAALAYELVR